MSDIYNLPDRSESRFSENPEHSYTIPARHYFDPLILEQEKRSIFFKSWIPVAHTGDLAQYGSYITATIADQHVLVIRTENGSLSAFYNVCQHRGHLLLQDKGQARKLITCPYHAWTYDHDGHLVAAPNCEAIRGFDKADFSVPRIRVEEFFGFIFVNLDPEAAAIRQCYPGLESVLDEHFTDPTLLQEQSEILFDINGNWKNVGDNALECYHCSVAHKDFVNIVDMSTYQLNSFDNWSIQHGTCRPDNKVYDFREALPLGDRIIVVFMFPGFFISKFAGTDGILTFQFGPTGPESTHQRLVYYGRGNQMTDIEAATMKYFNDVLGPEDVSLVESVQKGLHSLGYHQGRFMIDGQRGPISEHTVHHFHSMILNALDSK